MNGLTVCKQIRRICGKSKTLNEVSPSSWQMSSFSSNTAFKGDYQNHKQPRVSYDSILNSIKSTHDGCL